MSEHQANLQNASSISFAPERRRARGAQASPPTGQGIEVALTRRGFLGTTAVGTTSLAATLASLGQAAEPSPLIVAAYAGRLSYRPGQTLQLHTSTAAASYDVVIERVGRVREVVWTRKGIAGQEYAVPEDASANGCGWPVGCEVAIDNSWRSGYYEVSMTPRSREASDQQSPPRFATYFVVRASAHGPHNKVLLTLSTNTDNAYNNWGGYSLYAYNGRDMVQGRRVSFARPMPSGTIQRWELPFIRWCESQGYELDYAVNNDLEEHPQLLETYRLMLSVGHDEYWTQGMRDQLEAFIARGGNVAFFSGNVCCWQVRHEDNGLVCFKEFYRDDPLYRPDGPNPRLSTLWSHHLIDRPENMLTGVGVLGGGFHQSHGQYMDGSGAFTTHRPEHWVFAGTNLQRDEEFGGEHSIVGYECDGCDFEMRDGLPVATGIDRTPQNFQILASAPAKWGPETTLNWYDRWPQEQQGAACLGVYQHPGGGTVFTAGTTDWSHGLANDPDPRVARITRNVLERLS